LVSVDGACVILYYLGEIWKMATKTKTDDSVIGIYISSETIVLAKTSLSSGKIITEHLVRFPTNFTSKEKILKPLVLNNAFFDEKAPWINPLKQALSKVQWKAKKVVITLSNEFSIVRYFTMPYVEKKFWPNSIPLESKKYLPVSFEEVSYHFYVLPKIQEKKMEVLFGLTQRKSIEFLINLFKKQGYEVVSVESSSCSFERLCSFLNPQHEKSAYGHFTKTTSFLIFSSQGMPLLFRETNLATASQMTGRTSLGIKGALQFISRYVGDSKYSAIYLSGENLEVWQNAAQRESSLETKIWQPEKSLGLKDNELSSLYAAGAAIKNQVKHKVFIDMSGISTNVMIEQKVISYVKNATIVIVAIFLFFTLLNQFKIYLLSKKISRLYSSMGVNMADFQGKDASSIETMTENLESIAKTFGDLFFDKTVLAPKLEVIADAIPKYLWIESINYTSPVRTGDMQTSPKEMVIRGSTNLKGNLRLHYVKKFVDEFKKSKDFSEFQGPVGNIVYTIDAQPQLTETEEESSEKSAEIYGFSINCTRKTKGT